jgi:hypothetical protein
MAGTPLTAEVYVAPMRPFVGASGETGDQPMWSPMSSTLIAGEREAILVDTLVAFEQVDALAEWVRGFGKHITGVYITHGHSDHWIGLAQLQKHFPDAQGIATPEVVQRARFEATDLRKARTARPGWLWGRVGSESLGAVAAGGAETGSRRCRPRWGWCIYFWGLGCQAGAMSEPGEPKPSGSLGRRRWVVARSAGGQRPVAWQVFLGAGALIVVALVVSQLARGASLSPALILVIPLVVILAIGILARR